MFQVCRFARNAYVHKLLQFQYRTKVANPVSKKYFGDFPDRPNYASAQEKSDESAKNGKDSTGTVGNKKSRELVESILNCPLCLDEWDDVPQAQKRILKSLSSYFDTVKLPSVSKVIGGTRSALNELILSRWMKKKKKELGEEGFQKYMTDLREGGKAFHMLIQEYLSGTLEKDVHDSGLWKSVSPVFNDLGKIYCVEKEVNHPLLCYQGRLDCVAEYKGKLCVLDWKSSQKRKDTLSKCYDDPYQVAAYVGAFNISSDPSNQIRNAVIIKAYPDGSTADVHYLNEFNLDFFWNAWLRRIARYHSAVIESSVQK